MTDSGAAIEHLEQAASIYGELEHRPMQGASLGELGVALAALGQIDAARNAWEHVERLLRDTGHPVMLAMLLCQRGCHQAACGVKGDAQSALSQAVAIAEQSNSPAESQLGGWIARLRQALAGQ